MSRLRLGGALVCLLGSGCEPPLLVGDLQCSGGASEKNANGVFNEGPLPAPWQTSFEDGFCGYKYRAGFCYGDASSAYRLVTEPVHTGPFAAAFEMRAGDSEGIRQARCVREGLLPEEAYYGAWYYVPSGVSAAHDWNLFHFAGGEPKQQFHGLWNISMDDRAGALGLYLGNVAGKRRHDPVPTKAIPLDRWFQLEFYLKSAADTSGEVALYQDGEELLRVTGVVTNDTPFTQWYVGNFTASFAPNSPTFSVYVDDVSVRLP